MTLTRAQLNLLIGHQVVVKGEPGEWTLVQTMTDEGVVGIIEWEDEETREYKDIYYTNLQFQVRPLSSITSEELQRLLDLGHPGYWRDARIEDFIQGEIRFTFFYQHMRMTGRLYFNKLNLDQYLYLFERRLDVLGLIEKGYGILPDKS